MQNQKIFFDLRPLAGAGASGLGAVAVCPDNVPSYQTEEHDTVPRPTAPPPSNVVLVAVWAGVGSDSMRPEWTQLLCSSLRLLPSRGEGMEGSSL